jgi:D-alanine transaminase
VEEAYEADEAFLSSATPLIYPIVEIDGRPIGSGEPGPVTKQLRELYWKAMREETAQRRRAESR